MSLNVPVALLQRAADGEVDDAAFLDCVRTSLPYAWQVISTVAATLDAADAGVEFTDHELPPPGDHERGQLLRALASDAIRGGLERHFAVRLAFQNCHRVAAFRPTAIDGPTPRGFVSAQAQLLNQRPELRNC